MHTACPTFLARTLHIVTGFSGHPVYIQFTIEGDHPLIRDNDILVTVDVNLFPVNKNVVKPFRNCMCTTSIFARDNL